MNQPDNGFLTDYKYIENAEIIREKGTNRSKFFRGQIDKYTWVEVGSSYLPSDLNAAYLWAQLEKATEINEYRLACWKQYYTALKRLEEREYIELPFIPKECVHNAHMFYIKTRDLQERIALMSYLKGNGIATAFHYVPLHSAPAGKKYGIFFGEDKFTTKESERLLRLPMYYGIESDLLKVIECVKDFYMK